MIFFYFLSKKKKKLEKYEYVGRLLRPGEEPNSYSDEEEESSESAATKAHKSEDNIKNLNSSATTATVTDKPKDEWPVNQTIDSNVSNQNYENSQHTSKSHAHP